MRIPKEVDIWLRQGIPLGAEGRFQLIFKFNTNVKNLFGDAVAFYFLYGPQRFMNLIGLIAIGCCVYVSVIGALGFDWGRALNSNEDMNKYVNKELGDDIHHDLEGYIDRD